MSFFFFHFGHHQEWKGLIMMTNRSVQTGFELYVSKVLYPHVVFLTGRWMGNLKYLFPFTKKHLKYTQK